MLFRSIRMYKKHGPTVRAIKTISFCTSLVSLLSLQTAMFATFGKDTTIKMQCLMNGITGMITCFSILLIGCYMYCKGRKEEGVIDDKDISGRR